MDDNMSKVERTNKSSSVRLNRYTDDFKRQVMEVWHSGAYATIVECAKNYNINENRLYNWLHQAKKRHAADTPEKYSVNNQEVLNLKKELARARTELDILKKAAIYFANHAR